MKNKIKSSEITPENVYLNRRTFLGASLFAGTSILTTGIYKFFNKPPPPLVNPPFIANVKPYKNTLPPADKPNTYKEITNYNNFYEFSTEKSEVAEESKSFITRPWTVEVSGMVHKPTTFGIEELFKFEQEERIYRLRCVEGWSMVIPWVGFPLKKLLDKVNPLGKAKFVAFETYFDKSKMPNWESANIDLPYVEGLRLDEALNNLTILATGLYGREMPNQNGAPIRLVVPWKYGFKSIKSITKITLTDIEPKTTWHSKEPTQYGFYSNVNPNVSSVRWSQSDERRIGDFGTRETMMFNGYADEVASMYSGMDLKKHF